MRCQSIQNEVPNEAVNPSCRLLADTKKTFLVCIYCKTAWRRPRPERDMYPGVRSPISSHMIRKMRWLRTPSKPTLAGGTTSSCMSSIVCSVPKLGTPAYTQRSAALDLKLWNTHRTLISWQTATLHWLYQSRSSPHKHAGVGPQFLFMMACNVPARPWPLYLPTTPTSPTGIFLVSHWTRGIPWEPSLEA
jgi:hypothetical protein